MYKCEYCEATYDCPYQAEECEIRHKQESCLHEKSHCQILAHTSSINIRSEHVPYLLGDTYCLECNKCLKSYHSDSNLPQEFEDDLVALYKKYNYLLKEDKR